MRPLREIAESQNLTDYSQLVAARYTGPHSTTWDVEDCVVELVLRTNSGDRRLTIECRGVAKFAISRAGGGVTQVIGLGLEDWTNRGLDTIAWRLFDYENGTVDVLCKSVRGQVDDGW